MKKKFITKSNENTQSETRDTLARTMKRVRTFRMECNRLEIHPEAHRFTAERDGGNQTS